MIPRLWQCADPKTWELWLGAPLSRFAFVALAALSLFLSMWDLPGRRLLRRLQLGMAAFALSVTGVGLLLGLVLAVVRFNPSWGYGIARAIWIFGAWPACACLAWLATTRHWPQWRRLNEGAAFAVLTAVAVLLCIPDIAPSLMDRSAVLVLRVLTRGFFDDLTTRLQTDACLAEHRLTYLAGKDIGYSVERWPGEAAERTLDRRRPWVSLDAYAEGLRGYRLKVRRGELMAPYSLNLAACRDCGGVIRELRTWAEDEAEPDESRRQATGALISSTHPPPPPPTPAPVKRVLITLVSPGSTATVGLRPRFVWEPRVAGYAQLSRTEDFGLVAYAASGVGVAELGDDLSEGDWYWRVVTVDRNSSSPVSTIHVEAPKQAKPTSPPPANSARLRVIRIPY